MSMRYYSKFWRSWKPMAYHKRKSESNVQPVSYLWTVVILCPVVNICYKTKYYDLSIIKLSTGASWMLSCLYLCKHSCRQVSSHKQSILIELVPSVLAHTNKYLNIWFFSEAMFPLENLEYSSHAFSILPFYLYLLCVPIYAFLVLVQTHCSLYLFR